MGVGGARGHLGKLRGTRAVLWVQVIEEGFTGEVGAPAMAVLAVCGEDGHGAAVFRVRDQIS